MTIIEICFACNKKHMQRTFDTSVTTENGYEYSCAHYVCTDCGCMIFVVMPDDENYPLGAEDED